jgi:sugar phosphate isomerase/epimerase
MAFTADRIACSTISLRYLPLAEALSAAAAKGFTWVDLGALPGVCDHVPYVLTSEAIAAVATTVRAAALGVCSVNGDIGDLNEPGPQAAATRREHLDRLVELCVAVGSPALVLPNGRQDRHPIRSLEEDLAQVAAELRFAARRAAESGVQLWVEAPHVFRLCHDVELTRRLVTELPAEVGLVCDFSHIVASKADPVDYIAEFGSRIAHVHLRDARVGNINLSIGRGEVDFAAGIAALRNIGYTGRLALELETRDVADRDRADVAQSAAEYISALL